MSEKEKRKFGKPFGSYLQMIRLTDEEMYRGIKCTNETPILGITTDTALEEPPQPPFVKGDK